MSEVIEMVQVPKETFNRMVSALVRVERFLEVTGKEEWVTKETALNLLGCSERTLIRLKEKKTIRYKAVGKEHQYSRKSIDKYNELLSV
jgi:hypothetical protein